MTTKTTEAKEEEKEKFDLHSALRTIQQRLNAPKDLHNKFGNYMYRSCESILKAAKPLLDLTNTTLIFEDNIMQIGDRFYIKSEAILCNGTEKCSAAGFAREDLAKKGMDGSQVTGATSSYARKYALNALFAIDDNKDSDALNHHATTDKDITKQAITEIKKCETESQLMQTYKYYNSIVPNLCEKDAPIQVALARRKKQLEGDSFSEE